MPAPPDPTSPADPGRPAGESERVDRFTLQRCVGRGGAAEVWKAVDGASGQTVALKRLLASARPDTLEEMRERLLEEGRIATRLQHPDIVACIALGKEAGRPWLALEWLEGRDLSHHVPIGQRLPVAVAVGVAARVARALDHAHRQGVVHRDLKPANIHVDLTTSTVKLADFGVARQVDNARTTTGLFLGTPAYMAPEQLAGAPADARGDLYALGVVLFELLSSRRPHEASSLGELLRRVARDGAPDVRTLNPAVPSEVALALARVLERDPALRHTSGRDFADALTASTLAPEGFRSTPPP